MRAGSLRRNGVCGSYSSAIRGAFSAKWTVNSNATGPTEGDYGTLLVILESPGRRLRIGELAEILSWEKSRASHQVTRLERRLLVKRESASGDKRGTTVTLTPQNALFALPAVRGHAEVVRNTFLGHLGNTDRAPRFDPASLAGPARDLTRIPGSRRPTTARPHSGRVVDVEKLQHRG